MGLLKKLGKAAADAAKQGALNSVAKSIYTKYLNPVANTSTTEYYDAVDTELQSTSTFSGDMSLYDYKNTVDKSGKQETINIEKIQNESTGLDKNNLLYNVNISSSEDPNYVDTKYIDSNVDFYVPNWGYTDFINERAAFQKGLLSPYGEQGWFYFKIFFNFDTQYGLFGGLLNDKNAANAINSAARYLYINKNNGIQFESRYKALHKFAGILSYINSNAPWFFHAIKNVNQADKPFIDDFEKERSIELEFLPDAIDMRITTLFDLYRYIIYDDVNGRIILPDNLRKFDMSVLVFEAPLKYIHTAMYSNATHKSYRYKTVNPNTTKKSLENLMSYKIYTFVNCEIDKDSLTSIMPAEMNNEKPFALSEKATIKINYDRCYTHTSNEFFGILFGSDGFYYDRNLVQNSLQEQRYEALQQSLEHVASQKNYKSAKSYKNLVDMSEAICNFNLISAGIDGLGNIYGENQVIRNNTKLYNNEANNTSTTGYYAPNENTYNATLTKKNLNALFKNKLTLLHSRNNFAASEGVALLSKWLHLNFKSKLGNIYSHNPYTREAELPESGNYNMGVNGNELTRMNSDYLNDKLATLHGNPNKYTNTEYDRFYKKKTISVDNINVTLSDK